MESWRCCTTSRVSKSRRTGTPHTPQLDVQRRYASERLLVTCDYRARLISERLLVFSGAATVRTAGDANGPHTQLLKLERKDFERFEFMIFQAWDTYTEKWLSPDKLPEVCCRSNSSSSSEASRVASVVDLIAAVPQRPAGLRRRVALMMTELPSLLAFDDSCDNHIPSQHLAAGLHLHPATMYQ